MRINFKRTFPFIHFTRDSIESGNTISMKRKYGNSDNTLIVKGRNNIIESCGKVRKTKIRVIGNANSILFGEKCNIFESSFVVIGNNCKISIGAKATCGKGCWMVVMGENNHINIGLDVMMADEVDVWASDSHPIYDMEKNRLSIINPSGNIDINDHVWIGKKAIILKNVTIGENSIVGMASVVTKDISSGCVVVGNPAYVVKRKVSWDRNHINI